MHFECGGRQQALASFERGLAGNSTNAALLDGLGVEQSGSTAFGSLVDETLARMDADEGLRQDMARAVAMLLASAAMTSAEKAGDR